jgi:HEAT repeat protein
MADSPPDPKSDEVLALIEGLRTAYPPDFRAWAAEKLGEYDAEATVPLLVAALEDPETAVVLGATRALAETGDPSALPALRALLSHPDAGVRDSAQEAIEALE